MRRLGLVLAAVLAVVAGLVALVALTSPLWLARAGALVAGQYGLTWEAAESDGYQSLRLDGVRYHGEGVTVEVDRVRLPQPLGWARGLFIPGAEFAAEAGEIVVSLAERDAERAPAPPPAPAVIRAAAARAGRVLPWLPAISAERLELRREGSGTLLAASNLRLANGALEGVLLERGVFPHTGFRAWLGQDMLRLAARARIAEGETRLRVAVRAGPDGFVLEADLRADDLDLPGADGESVMGDVRIHADAEGLRVEAFDIATGWLRASLSSPVSYDYATLAFSGAALLDVEAVLEAQGLVPASGTVRARMEVRPPREDGPEMVFRLSGADLQLGGVILDRIEVDGLLAYPMVEVSHAEIVLAQMLSLAASGRYSLTEQAGAVRAAFTLEQDWLERAVAGAPLAGPLAVELDADWRRAAPQRVGLRLAAENASGGAIAARLEVEREVETGRVRVDVEEATVTLVAKAPLELEAPFTAVVQPGLDFPLESLSRFSFVGGQTRLAGSFDSAGPSVLLEASGLAIRDAESWLTRALPEWVIERLELDFPLLTPFAEGRFHARLRGAHDLAESFEVVVSGTLDADGLDLSALEGTIAGQPFVTGALRLPLRLHPFGDAAGRRFSSIRGGLMEGSLVAEIAPELVRDLESGPMIELLRNARVDVTLGGTLDAPEAALEGGFEEIDLAGFGGARFAGFTLRGVSVAVGVTPETLTLHRLEGILREALVSVTGHVPMDLLRDAVADGGVDWRAVLSKAELETSFSGFRASQFQSLLPGYLRPRGRASGSARIEEGGRLSGRFELEGFSLRPTLYSQSIDNIRLTLDLEGTRLTIREAGGFVGESAVDINGFVDLADPREPLFSIAAGGVRTPLVRTPDLLLMADVELGLDRRDPGTPATLSGIVNIRDSVLIMDFDPLAARTAGGGMARPPFFSVETAPFADWMLDIDIRGEEALRFRSQFASALVSADLHLGGTLADPVWVGRVTSTEGSLLFPGTRLSLSRGEVFITRERQESLQLDVNTIGQVASHILSMRVQGTANNPQVELASTPALSNARILQLLATGSLERGGLGSVGLYLGRGLLAPSAGGDSFLDRLSVEVGRDISETGRNTIDVFYRFSERLRLHGQYDKYDAQNIDLEWEVFSR